MENLESPLITDKPIVFGESEAGEGSMAVRKTDGVKEEKTSESAETQQMLCCACTASARYYCATTCHGYYTAVVTIRNSNPWISISGGASISDFTVVMPSSIASVQS